MNKAEHLLGRLDEIGEALSKKSSALALIGLGSVGLELNRLDQFSDLDFFVIVKTGSKPRYLEDLSWLTEIAPVAYCFANTPDGYKLLYEDGVFCEFAVFDKDELKEAVFSPGRVVWKAQGVSDTIGIPQCSVERKQESSTEWLIGEALTNLYVGLSREQRGEKLSALRFIQGYAVDRIVELSKQIEVAASLTAGDEFSIERRYEQRFPAMARILPELLQGYERNRESALAALSYLDKNFEINSAMKQAVLELADASAARGRLEDG
jgi:lincosamide nucleotidyltransferase